MSTRTYQITFNAPGTASMPAGVFFYVKSASAALTIATRGSTTAPIRFENVGAGLKFGPVPPEKRWTYLDITSAVAQTVELVVSDDAEVDIASTVTVSGSVSVTEVPATAGSFGSRATIAAGAHVDIPANASRKRITIYNWTAGAGGVLTVRDTGGTTDAGGFVEPGTYQEFKATYALRLRNNSASALDYSYIEDT